MDLKTKIINGEVIGIETKERRVQIRKLIDYVLEYGFKHDGVWYFRNSWMNHNYARLFESAGLIEKEGSPDDLRHIGVNVPNTPAYTVKGGIQIYRVNDDKINLLEPNQ